MIETSIVKPCGAMIYRKGYNRPVQCGKPSKVEFEGRNYCQRHDPVKVEAKNKALHDKWELGRQEDRKIREAKQRRAEAGEMGIELAKVVLAYLGCTGNGWARIANTAEMNRLVRDAQSIVEKLEGK